MDGGLRQSGPPMRRLMSENETIEYLGLSDRPNPAGALRWLMRVHKLAHVRLAKGIYGFKIADLDAYIDGNHVGRPGRR